MKLSEGTSGSSGPEIDAGVAVVRVRADTEDAERQVSEAIERAVSRAMQTALDGLEERVSSLVPTQPDSVRPDAETSVSGGDDRMAESVREISNAVADLRSSIDRISQVVELILQSQDQFG